MGKNADFSQFEKFCKNWRDAYKDFDDFLRKFLLEMAQRAIADISKNTPVDTGALRASWFIADVVVSGNDLHVTIGNSQSYSSFVEYGHRNWLNNSWVDGYFMMTIGIDRVNQQLPLRFQKAFENYLTEKGAT